MPARPLQIGNQPAGGAVEARMGTSKNWSAAAGLAMAIGLVVGCGSATAGIGGTASSGSGPVSMTAGSTVTTTAGCADEEPPVQGDFTPGAAVMNDLPDDVIVGGVPARIMGASRRGA